MRLVGKLVLDHYAKSISAPQAHYSRSGLGGLLEWELALFGYTNAEAGAIVMASWHFPAAIAEPINQHYCTRAPTGPHIRMTCLLNVACGIAAELGYGLPGEEKYWQETPEKLQMAGLLDYQVRQSVSDARLGFEAIKHSLD
jgi:HD-like signal output (HDOD) protein